MVEIIIENLEPILSRWVLIEYENASKLIGKIIITNVKSESDRIILSKIAVVRRERACELYDKAIILDPQAKEELTPEDASKANVAVIGGILGDHPPRGRTRTLLTRTFKEPIARNIGSKQFSIDGAAFVAHMVLNKGYRLNELEYIDGIVLKRRVFGLEHIIELPYRYPLVNGKPIISDKLVKMLTTCEVELFEELVFNRIKNK